MAPAQLLSLTLLSPPPLFSLWNTFEVPAALRTFPGSPSRLPHPLPAPLSASCRRLELLPLPARFVRGAERRQAAPGSPKADGGRKAPRSPGTAAPRGEEGARRGQPTSRRRRHGSGRALPPPRPSAGHMRGAGGWAEPAAAAGVRRRRVGRAGARERGGEGGRERREELSPGPPWATAVAERAARGPNMDEEGGGGGGEWRRGRGPAAPHLAAVPRRRSLAAGAPGPGLGSAAESGTCGAAPRLFFLSELRAPSCPAPPGRGGSAGAGGHDGAPCPRPEGSAGRRAALGAAGPRPSGRRSVGAVTTPRWLRSRPEISRRSPGAAARPLGRRERKVCIWRLCERWKE